MDQIPSKIPGREIWIVSPPRYGRFAIDRYGSVNKPIMGQEYRISSIGRYMLSPQPLHVRKLLMGCEVHLKSSAVRRVRTRMLGAIAGKPQADQPPISLHLSLPKYTDLPVTMGLNRHIETLYEKLRPMDPVFQTLNNLNPKRIAKVVGICEDDAGFRSPLTIEGGPVRQLDFAKKHIGQKVNVRLKRAYVANGLFEMKGFDFINYNPNVSSRLIRFIRDGKHEACVLDSDHDVAFWLDDVELIKFLQLLEYCIQQNQQMYESFSTCVQGKAVPIRLIFSQRIAIDYTRAPLPSIFQKVIGEASLPEHTSALVKQKLNDHQFGISFNFLSQQKTGKNELCTEIAILQNLRALEPIKDRVPMLFDEMEKRAARSEGEKFYLLESIRGVQHGS